MVSAGISWYGATKPFFVSEKGVKVNGPVYHKHLRTELFPAINKLVKRKDWIFAQDGANIDGKNRWISKDEWPPSSPDTNPLDYWFWDAVKTKVYEGRGGIRDEDELKSVGNVF